MSELSKIVVNSIFEWVLPLALVIVCHRVSRISWRLLTSALPHTYWEDHENTHEQRLLMSLALNLCVCLFMRHSVWLVCGRCTVVFLERFLDKGKANTRLFHLFPAFFLNSIYILYTVSVLGLHMCGMACLVTLVNVHFKSQSVNQSV